MPNTIDSIVDQKWASQLQENLFNEVVSFTSGLADSKFEALLSTGNTVNFSVLTKQTVAALASDKTDVPTNNVVTTNETLLITTRLANAFELSQQELKQMIIDPTPRLLEEVSNAYMISIDTSILAQYANATYTIDDGDMPTATNGGLGNHIIASKTNIYDVFVAANKKSNQNNIPKAGRIAIVSPSEEAELVSSPEFIRATSLGDTTVTGGHIGRVLNWEIFVSNNLTTVGTTRHAIFATKGAVSYAAQLKPVVEHTPSTAQRRFTDFWKSRIFFGIKTFTEGANRMLDVQLFAN